MLVAPSLTLECGFRSGCEDFAGHFVRLAFVAAGRRRSSLDLASEMLRLTLCSVSDEALGDLVRFGHPRSRHKSLPRENTNIKD